MKIVYHYAKVPGVAKIPTASTIKNDFITVQEVKVIDKEKELYEVHEVRKVKKSVDTNKLAQSFAGSCGVEAIMKKVAITGDTSILNTQTGEVFTDITKVPTTIHEAQALLAKGQKAFDSLDPKLKGDAQDANELLSNLTLEKLQKYINDAVASQVKKSEVKTDE